MRKISITQLSQPYNKEKQSNFINEFEQKQKLQRRNYLQFELQTSIRSKSRIEWEWITKRKSTSKWRNRRASCFRALCAICIFWIQPYFRTWNLELGTWKWYYVLTWQFISVVAYVAPYDLAASRRNLGIEARTCDIIGTTLIFGDKPVGPWLVHTWYFLIFNIFVPKSPFFWTLFQLYPSSFHIFQILLIHLFIFLQPFSNASN